MGELTGTCPIREHAGDGGYVGRCDFATYDYVCPRHGYLIDYPTNDDREVAVEARRFPVAKSPRKKKWAVARAIERWRQNRGEAA